MQNDRFLKHCRKVLSIAAEEHGVNLMAGDIDSAVRVLSAAIGHREQEAAATAAKTLQSVHSGSPEGYELTEKGWTES